MHLTLRWNRLFSPDRAGHIAWSRKEPGEEFPLHDHDFPEVFWVSEGGLRHEINGLTTDLTRGQLVFIRAADRHGFRGIGEHAGVVCNFATRTDVVAHLRQRYFAGWPGAWWHAGRGPAAVALTAAELHTLDHAAREFATVPDPDLHATERFLLNLLHVVRQHGQPARLGSEPAWLATARLAMTEPRHLARGVPRLVRLAGCSPEHLARTVRRVHGVTPTELVNQLRLAWAGAELQYSSREIAEIALAAGFDSLSHFYHLFRRQHGVPPRQFRVRARSLA
jgi:AraC family cel operon transcriptional repressor